MKLSKAAALLCLILILQTMLNAASSSESFVLVNLTKPAINNKCPKSYYDILLVFN